MARFPTVEEAKRHLRIENDEEDGEIALLIEGSREAIESFLNKKVYDETEQASDPEGTPLNNKMKIAQLLIIGHWYRNRENSSEKSLSDIPYGARDILIPMRKFNA